MQEATEQSSFLEKVRGVFQSRFPYINNTARAIFAAAALTAMTARESSGATLKSIPGELDRACKGRYKSVVTIPLEIKQVDGPRGCDILIKTDCINSFIKKMHLDQQWDKKRRLIKGYAYTVDRGPFKKLEDKGIDGDESVYTYVRSWDPTDYYIYSQYARLVDVLDPQKQTGVNWHPERKNLKYRQELLALKDVFDIAVRNAILSSGSVEKACKGYEPWALIAGAVCFFILGNCAIRSIHGGRNDSTMGSTTRLAAAIGSIIVGCMCLTTGGPGPLGSPHNVEKTLKKAFKEAKYFQRAGSNIYNIELYALPPYDNMPSNLLTPEQAADYKALKEIREAKDVLTYSLFSTNNKSSTAQNAHPVISTNPKSVSSGYQKTQPIVKNRRNVSVPKNIQRYFIRN